MDSGGLYTFGVVLGLLTAMATLLSAPLFCLHLYLQYPARVSTPEAGRCARCKYDLRGLSGAVCPECGEDAEATKERERARRAEAVRGDWRTIGKIGVVAVMPVVAVLVAALVWPGFEQALRAGERLLSGVPGSWILLLGIVAIQVHLGMIVLVTRGRRVRFVTPAVAIGMLLAAVGDEMLTFFVLALHGANG